MILLNVVGMIPIIRRATDLSKMKFKVAMVGIGNLYGIRIDAQVFPMPLERTNIRLHARYGTGIARNVWLLLIVMRQAFTIPALGRWASRKGVKRIASNRPGRMKRMAN